MKDEFIKRKNELSKYALNSYLSNDAFIYKIINNKKLDFLISKIDNRKTITNTNCLIKKGYLTANEQFIDLLNNLCLIFDNDFIFIGKYRSSVLEIILNYKKNYKFFLCKNYWGNNDFIPYYKFNIKKYLITGFYNNIKYLFDESENIKKLLDINNIKLYKTCLNHEKDINKLYQLLQKIVICNNNEYCIFYIFDDINFVITDTEKNITMV